MKKKKRPVLGYLPINTSLDNSINTNNSLNVSKIPTYRGSNVVLDPYLCFLDDKIFHG